MKKGILRATMLLFIAVQLAFVQPARGEPTVYWDFEEGFSPDTVTIEPGGSVVWINFDIFGFDLEVTFDNSFSFTLEQYEGMRVFFPQQPGTYGYHSNWGDNGVVIVSAPPAADITLVAPRLETGQFLFDVTGLTAGKSNVLQTSTNLTDWTALSTNIASSSTMTFTNSAAAGARFFRVYEIP